MTAILGISAFYHDSAASILIDGEIAAAAQEERFTREKHDAGFPANAIAYCLEEVGLKVEQLDYIAFYDKPLTKFDRLLETHFAFAPRGFQSFSKSMPVWIMEKLFLRRTLRAGLPGSADVPLLYMDHHESHASSAFFPSPYSEAAILTLDGVGEWTTSACGIGKENKIKLIHQLEFPHSLGLLYSAFTYYCGFKVNSGEYKLMGLAPYGKPVYTDLIYQHLVDLKPDGTFWLNMKYFNYCGGLTMTNSRFDGLFGGKPRKPEANLEQRHMDLAASIQEVTEQIILRLSTDVHRKTGMKYLVLAGGVALNCVANGRLLREGPFEDIWIQPAAGDAGGALGAALFVWHQLLDKPRIVDGQDRQRGSLLGPSFSPATVRQVLDCKGTRFESYPQEIDLIRRTSELLAAGKIVGWFQGRMEFGPRALGARSILGDARSPTMQTVMNMKIKFRESFRPFAPCVLAERAHEWFNFKSGQESPYMLLVADVLKEHRTNLTSEQFRVLSDHSDLRQRVNVPRSIIPAVTHLDYSARVLTVDKKRNPKFYALLRTFYDMTGCPVLVNTSFNVRGEPIVCTPADAYNCYVSTEMDALVMEDSVLEKAPDLRQTDEAARNRYLAQFQLD